MTFALLDSEITQWAAGLGWPIEGLLRLCLAAVCGGLVGIEREIRGHQAGFRTHLLVCVGSAIVMIVSVQLSIHPWHTYGDPHVNINTDPGRIAYGVMTGIGFLGAGTILHDKGSIRGLTTAAALWCTAAMGLGAGMGLYLFTLLAAVIVLLALWALHYIEPFLPQAQFRRVSVITAWSPNGVASVVQYFKRRRFRVVATAFDREPGGQSVRVIVDVSFYTQAQHSCLEGSPDDERPFEIVAVREIQK